MTELTSTNSTERFLFLHGNKLFSQEPWWLRKGICESVDPWTSCPGIVYILIPYGQPDFSMCLAYDSSSMPVRFMIIKDYGRVYFAYRTYLLVDRGPQSGGQPGHAWLGLWGPGQISADRSSSLAAYQPNGSSQSRCYGPCNCTQDSPMSALALLMLSATCMFSGQDDVASCSIQSKAWL